MNRDQMPMPTKRWSEYSFAVATVALLAFSTPVIAVPVSWSLTNVQFEDGGVSSGSFVYDTALALPVSDWNISVSGGDEAVFPSFTYTPATAPVVTVFDTGLGGQSVQFSIDPFALGGTPGSRLIVLTSIDMLSDAGGTVDLLLPGDPFLESRECYNCNPFRLIVSGSLVGSQISVPEPSTLMLFLIGFLGMIVVQLRYSHCVAQLFSR